MGKTSWEQDLIIKVLLQIIEVQIHLQGEGLNENVSPGKEAPDHNQLLRYPEAAKAGVQEGQATSQVLADLAAKSLCFWFHRCLSLGLIAVKRRHDHSNSYKRQHLTGAGLQF